MNRNTKNTEDDANYGDFIIGGASFSYILKTNQALVYILIVEVAGVNLYMEVMGGSSIKTSGVHSETVWEDIYVAYKVLDKL